VEKCIWTPQISLDWNGMNYNFESKGIKILPKRIESALQLLSDIKDAWPNVSFRTVSSFVGKVLSMHPVFCGTEQLCTRMLQTIVNIRNFKGLGWDSPITVDYKPLLQYALNELLQWPHIFSVHNFRSFQADPSTFVGWSDASDIAVAGLIVKLRQDRLDTPFTADSAFRSARLASRAALNCVENFIRIQPRTVRQRVLSPKMKDASLFFLDSNHIDNVFIAHRSLQPFEKTMDSNERELIAAVELISGCKNVLRNSKITLHFDNMNAASICKKGSPKPRLNCHALQIFDVCKEFNITLEPVWIPRDLNKVADFLSKVLDYEDYSVERWFFNKVVADSGYKPTVDCFANAENAKVPVFFSSVYCAGAAGVDCFNYNWALYGKTWLFPPPRLVLQTVNYLRVCKGSGLLLTPQWRNHAFWPELFCMSRKYLRNMLVYGGKNVFRLGSDAGSYFGPDFAGNVVVWHLDFSD